MKLTPMKCYLGTVDDLKHPGWIYEPKLDGIRALCYINQHIKLVSRAGNDLTKQFPELSFRTAIKASSCMLDGEIIGYNKKGIPSFSALQKGNSATYVVFDILMLNGESLIKKPLLDRKKILDTILKSHATIEKIVFTYDGLKLWRIMKKKHQEGVVAKDPASHYLPGIRSRSWIKIKFTQSIECVIVGYTQEKRHISSLALALYNKDGQLHYLGKVGTGFNQQNMRELEPLLASLKTEQSPLDTWTTKKLPTDIIWVKPKLVAEVKFVQLTPFAMLRQSTFLRLRTDKKPKECTFKDQGLPERKFLTRRVT